VILGQELEFLRLLAIGTDLVHALAMLLWGLGLPLLFWHRFPRLSRAYMWFAIAFVGTSVLSHQLLGECFLTTLARELWQASGGYRDRVPFTVVLVNRIAGFRPEERAVVWLWEAAVVATSAASLWYWYRTRPGSPRPRPRGAPLGGARRSAGQA